MKRTYLELIQSVLNDADCDEVNDIDETTEARQVLSSAGDLFYEYTTRREWKWRTEFRQLTALSDSTRPVYLKAPEGSTEVEWFTYDGEKLTYRDPVDFFYNANKLDSTASNVVRIPTLSGGFFYAKNDGEPKYWTTVDDSYIICDSYDSAVDTTLQESKTQVLAKMAAKWQPSNNGVPPLPEELFPGFLAELKAACMPFLRQERHVFAEWQAQRQRNRNSYDSWRLAGGDTYPNYGRRGNKGGKTAFATGDKAGPPQKGGVFD